MHNLRVYLLPSFIILISAILRINAFPQTIRADKLINIGPPVNSSGADFAPSFTADGKTMLFNSKRGGVNYQHIYISHFENGKWSDPLPLNEINSKFNDESPFITSNGEFIFFSSDRDGSLEMPKDASGRIRVSFDIYVSKSVNGKWAAPIKVPGAVNTASHERTPGLSPDFQTLFYTSMPFGDVGKARIMKAGYRNGEFLDPVALPSPVNVNAQDSCFVPSPDGKGYFFSSRRAGGYGGWDLYYVKYENDKFGEPVNLGPEINSEKNEVNLSLINDSIYFCSDREGGYGSYDIYTANISVVDNDIKVTVLDKKTKKPLQAEMQISAKTGEDGGSAYTIRKKTDEKGEAVIKYHPLVKNMDITINQEGYLPLFETLDTASVKGKPRILELVPLEKEASFDVHSIYFDFESAKLKPESYPYLDALTDYLNRNKSMRFEIIGHTDLHGTDEFNDRLSLERATAVKDYLVGRGLSKERFSVNGMGKRRPVVRETGQGFDEKNRRTEFKLLEK